MVGEWSRDGSSGWVSSSHPSLALHGAADMTGGHWPGPLCLPHLPLWAGDSQGLKLCPLFTARSCCLCPWGCSRARAVTALVLPARGNGCNQCPDRTNSQWAAGVELHTCPQAPMEAGTAQSAQSFKGQLQRAANFASRFSM